MSWRSLIVLVGVGCGARAAPEPPRLCALHEVSVVDEAGAPLAGTQVHGEVVRRVYGPSGLPEGSVLQAEQGPVALTDAGGHATVCLPTASPLESFRPDDYWIVAEREGWPRARHPVAQRTQIVLGPGREVTVALACEAPSAIVAAYAVRDGHGDGIAHVATRRADGAYVLANLGPWSHWVTSNACGSTQTRLLDPRAAGMVALDGDDVLVAFAELPGATVTARAFRSTTPLATATLDARGTGVLSLADADGAVCLTIVRGDHCTVTFGRGGEVVTPSTYAGREGFLARDCTPCAPTAAGP